MQFHLFLEIICLWVNEYKRSEKHPIYSTCTTTSVEKGLPHRIPRVTTHHQSKESKPQRIRRCHVCSTWIEGPLGTQSYLISPCTRQAAIRAHKAVTQPKERGIGPIRGSPELGVWPNRLCGVQCPSSTCWSLVGSWRRWSVHVVLQGG
jgi:hypothetical protein